MICLFTDILVDLVNDNIANRLFSDDVTPELPHLPTKKIITKNVFKELVKTNY